MIDKLINIIKESDNIVVFTGAGTSTDSGLKDFRSEDGLYKKDYPYPAEYMLSHDCFIEKPDVFYSYYKENFDCRKIKPNDTHKLLKKLEDIGKLKAIITQNIDGLDHKAGIKNIYEVHGTVFINHCYKCGKEYDVNYIFDHKGIPKCSCGGYIKPDVVLYQEQLPSDAFDNGLKAISEADLLIVMGSSLTVYPAASMIDYFRGNYLVIINKDKTPYDYKADLVINDNLAKVSKIIMDSIK